MLHGGNAKVDAIIIKKNITRKETIE